ncbi:hypothetical protein K488DRAFT_46230 [Vararia minispora EC-137]|uniref:Uncharacterized protein n=1 Tax=Vararia minispora EC-137 TaxID=1314806 RepID=A0ACB8QQE2_9AGAM|nr:hypothetical protein K488DRAFT_46230 [Vararia minispora EC-137]
MTSIFPLPSPTFPDFSSLVISGPIHASASIHLCLTHLASRSDSQAVFLTPSRTKFLEAIAEFNDDWLNECGGYGAVSSILSRVISLYVRIQYIQIYADRRLRIAIHQRQLISHCFCQ